MKISKKDLRKIEGLDIYGTLDKISNYRSGEALFKLLKIGFSVLEIQTMLYLAPQNIEKRVLEYIDENNIQEEIAFIYNNVKGFPKLDSIKEYINSSLQSEKKFQKRKKEDFTICIKVYEKYEFIQQKIKEKEKLWTLSREPRKCFRKKGLYNHLSRKIIV